MTVRSSEVLRLAAKSNMKIKHNGKLSQSDLIRMLEYIPETGDFYWRNSGPGRKKSLYAGSMVPNGYKRIQINGTFYLNHRLAWLYVYGEWPEKQIDHMNHNRSDNRIENLKLADIAENARNRSLHPKNKSGANGVEELRPGKWRATIKVNKKSIHLGFFYSFEEAVTARKIADEKYGFHKNHGALA